MTRALNILVILALATYSSGYTVIPLQSQRVSTPAQRNLASTSNADIVITNVDAITYSGQIQLGTPPQNFSVIFDTGFSDMLFFSGCTFCQSINQYNASISNTSEDQLFTFKVNYYTSYNVEIGEVYEDYITLGGRYQVLGEFLAVDTPLQNINTQYDGVVGLGYQNGSSGPAPTLLQLLQIANTGIPQVFSLHLTSEVNQTGSSLIFGGYDSLTAPNGFTFYNVSQSLTWQLNIEDFGYNNKSYALTKGLYITLATGLPYIVASGNIFDELLPLFDPNTSCTQVALLSSFYLNIQGDVYEIPGSSLYTNNSGNCTLNLLAGANLGYNLSPNEILVGIPLFQNYYTMFDVENGQVGFATPVNPKPPTPVPNGSRIVTISMISTFIASFLYLLM